LRTDRRALLGSTANVGAPQALDDGDVEALNVDRAAARVGVSRTFLYEHISSGSLPTIKLGKRRLVRVEALRRWLKSLESRAA
jgi:excisionase family DNA binding protein